ncbi:hypothetical protein [Rhizobium sp. RU36D]|uniref:hypothetical protein n=1 Tax=Rhizobium sp. RU36D TaxID=1907415 RepID=UPI0009D7E208|nr:hypothetical protein [Rhizobium sp. RU36D]SMD16198.1 hypothetical protein SAMN05880593_1294 [Rhizobium sp. RU36D]
MKKTTIALAALLSSAIAVPAHANDAVRIGVGILGLVINEAAKAGNKGGNQRRHRNGDQMIGRVGEEPARNNGSRNRNKVAPAAVAGGAAVAAFALPEGDKAPIPVMKPTEQEMAEYAANLASSSTPEDVIDESIPLYDEQGRFWGAVAPADALKVEQAVALGMKPSTVIPDMLGLKLPETEPTSEQVPLIASTETTAEQAASFEADLNAAVAAEGGEPIQKAKVDLPATDPVQQAEIAVTEKEMEATELVPALPSQTMTADTSETPPAVDTAATTASVKSEPKVDLEAPKPVEVKKPKAKLDL